MRQGAGRGKRQQEQQGKGVTGMRAGRSGWVAGRGVLGFGWGAMGWSRERGVLGVHVGGSPEIGALRLLELCNYIVLCLQSPPALCCVHSHAQALFALCIACALLLHLLQQTALAAFGAGAASLLIAIVLIPLHPLPFQT